MRTRNIGMVAALVAAGFGTAACGSSGSKASGAAAASSPAAAATSSAATSAAASPSTSAPAALTSEQMKAALLAPSAYGSAVTSMKGYPEASDTPLGTVTDILGLDCSIVVGEWSPSIGSAAYARDMQVSSKNYDDIHEGVYQFASGDAAANLNDVSQKVGQCASFSYTPDDKSTTYHIKAKVEAVPGLGDQAIKVTSADSSAKWGNDTNVELDVRYGDVIIGVALDSPTASRATSYDLAAKVKAIADKLGLKATGA